MYLCDETITVLSETMDDDGLSVYTTAVISGVSWHADIAAAVDTSKGGLKTATSVTIRIPEESTDSPPKAGDLIYHGEADASVATDPSTVKVLGVTDNRRAKAPHWKVVCA